MILESFKSLALTTRPYQLRDNRAHEGPCQLQAATACSGSPRRPCGKHPLSLSGTPSFTLWSTTRSDDNHDRLQVQIIMDSLIPFTTSGSLVDCVDSTSVLCTDETANLRCEKQCSIPSIVAHTANIRTVGTTCTTPSRMVSYQMVQARAGRPRVLD